MEEISENQVKQPDLVQTPVAVPEKNIKPVTIVILLIAILLIGAGLVYVGMQMGKKQTPPVIPLQTESPTIIPTQVVQPTSVVIPPTNTPDATANWKTYTDSKYNYSFKYPDTEIIKITNYTGYLSSISLINTETKFEDMVFSVSSTDGSLSYNKNDKTYAVTTAGVAGFDATRVSLPIGQNPPQELVFFSRGGKYYAFQFVWDGKDPKSLNLFDQILSSFKFLE